MVRSLIVGFKRDRRGTIALITALVMFPLLFLALGVPIDLARAVQFRSAMQNISDSAVLAGQEVMAQGATANQSCIFVYSYVVTAQLLPSSKGGLPFPAGAETTSLASTSPGTTCATTPQTSIATAPNSVSYTLGLNMPTTFLSLYKPIIPIQVSSTATGPQGFITICVSPKSSGSADLDQAFYYLRATNGTLENQDGTVINQADAPGQSTGPGSPLPNGSGVELSAFLVDNQRGAPNGPAAPNGFCDAAKTQAAVTIKTGLGTRLGFEFIDVTAAQYPCYYKNQATDFSCLTNKTNYNYGPTTATNSLSSGNASGFSLYYNTYGVTSPTTWNSNAYGSTVGALNIFYSTDYPSSYNTSNLTVLNGLTVSPAVNNTCYETILKSGVITAINGYGAPSQGCLLSQSPAPVAAQNVGAQPDDTVTWSYNNSGQTAYQVCLASPGTTEYNGTAYTPTLANLKSGQGVYVTGTSSTSNVQQENMLISNSSTASPSLGAGVYKCPVNAIGNPYYPDPTCSELKGATLQVAWNDTGGVQNDNGDYAFAGTNTPDLYYTYSCAPPTAGALTSTALTQ